MLFQTKGPILWRSERDKGQTTMGSTASFYRAGGQTVLSEAELRQQLGTDSVLEHSSHFQPPAIICCWVPHGQNTEVWGPRSGSRSHPQRPTLGILCFLFLQLQALRNSRGWSLAWGGERRASSLLPWTLDLHLLPSHLGLSPLAATGVTLLVG